MQHQIHPDDERLAALAGGDPELGSDAELRAHVSICETCRATVDELAMLRSALAELPDLVPSRRLQLLPPVAKPRTTSTSGWLRRLSAPIMAAGLGLVLVGAVGTSGLLDNFAPATGSGSEVFAPGRASGQDTLEGAGGARPTATPRVPSYRGASSARSQASAASEDNRGPETASPSARLRASASPTDSAQAPESSGADQPTAPWLTLLLAGVAFVVTGGVLRVSVRPS